MSATIYRGQVLGATSKGGDPEVVEAVAVEGDRVTAVGTFAEVRDAAGDGAEVIDAPGLVVPGFVDAHTHLHMHGEAAMRADLGRAASVREIVDTLQAWHRANPDAPRVLGRTWYYHALDGRTPDRHMLDEAFPDVPVYLDAADLHSAWVNTAALRELGVDDSTPDPNGGRILREADGSASGLLEETAFTALVWPFLAEQRTDDERDAHLRRAVEDLHAVGITSAVDLAVGEREWASFGRAGAAGSTLRIGAHWLIDAALPMDTRLEIVATAAAQERDTAAMMHTRGIKIISDGVIDGCTAALSRPYTNGAMPDPMWQRDELVEVIGAAHAAGIAVAVHAIGDAAVAQALDAYEEVLGERPGPHRHRIEHLEYTQPDAAQRCAELGITASMQPIHADPFGLPNWIEVLGQERASRGFAWPEYVDAGATLAFGSDTPVTPPSVLGNLWVATTRRSTIDRDLDPWVPEYSLPMLGSLVHATRDAAYAAGLEAECGVLAPGMRADLVVLDRDVVAEGPESLLETKVVRTVAGGVVVFEG